MKRFISVLLVTGLLLSLISCDNSVGGGEEESTALSSSSSDTSAMTEETTVTEFETTNGVETTVREETTSAETADDGESSEESVATEATLTETTETATETATETENETTEEEIKMIYEKYTVKNQADVDLLLADATIIKIGYDYALVDGVRVKVFDEYTAPAVIGGKIAVYLDFVKENLTLNIKESDVVTNEYGDEFLPLDVITKTYTEYLYDADTGVIALYGKYSPEISADYEGNFNRDIVNKLALGYTVSAQMTGDRPVVFLNDDQLSLAISKAKAGLNPWYSAWESLENTTKRLIGTTPSPDTGKSAQAYRLAACKDMINARYLAIAYLYTEDVRYLETALVYLKAYAEPMLGTDKYLDYSAKTTDGQADIGLNIAAPLVTACDTYALLYNHISDADRQIIEKWIEAEANLCIKGHKFWIKEKYYGEQYGNNHLSSHLMGIIAAAYVLEDDGLLEYALCSSDNPANLKEMITRAILMEGDEVYGVDPDSDFTVGEVYDRYRVVQNTGFGYSLYHLKFLTYASMMLRNNGIDTFIYYGDNGENIALPYSVYSDYLIANDATLGNGHYTGNSLQRESSLNLYLIAYSVYRDPEMARVIEALEGENVACYENELFGASATFLFAYFPLY